MNSSKLSNLTTAVNNTEILPSNWKHQINELSKNYLELVVSLLELDIIYPSAF